MGLAVDKISFFTFKHKIFRLFSLTKINFFIYHFFKKYFSMKIKKFISIPCQTKEHKYF